jgi:hypothetical protein
MQVKPQIDADKRRSGLLNRLAVVFMSRALLAAFMLLVLSFSSTQGATALDVFWIDRYGDISWEDEKARLDNFAIQLLNEPNQIGYIIVNVGLVSCKGEAQARAVRAKNYMVRVRSLPENRIIWRDIGYSESLRVSLWLVPLGKPAGYNPDFVPASSKHIINKCVERIRKQRSHN